MESTASWHGARSAGSAALLALILTLSAAAWAQPAPDECSARLQRARGQYEEQQFAEVERLIMECVDRHALPAGEMDEGFRLLTLAYLRENLLADAQTTVIKHLAWSFTYEPDEVRDPPLYVALVRVTKAQLTVPPAALLASATPASAPAQRVSPPPPDDPPAETGMQVALPPEPLTTSEAVPPASTDPEPQQVDAEPIETADIPDNVGASPLASAAISLRERDGISDDPRPREATAGAETDNGVGLVADASGADAGGMTGGRYGGGLSAVPGTNRTPLLIPLPADVRSDKADPYNETLDFATVMPEIIGGPEAIRLEYPDFERRRGIEGRVVVRFVVDEQGDVSEAEVLRGVGPGLDAAALAALNRLSFTPARQNGQPARVRMTLTFRFQAPGSED